MLIIGLGWSPIINDTRLLIRTIKSFISEPKRPKQKGRKPKKLKEYLSLIVAKEARKALLRYAESSL
ncbi:MAG: hypothetical protein RQ930_00245 [Candidatus Aenigmarchaeota archaeon]|jgi:hypothetical protein|nr:hypothetical protein [Candidatus Aenigmarchaeota archaeon]